MKHRITIFIALLVLGGCSLIDDDLSVCGVDCRIDYEMRLVTNMRVKIEDVLRAEADKPLADTLTKWFAPIFSATAHDIDMSFFSTDGMDELRHRAVEIVDNNQTTFTFYLPREDYQHIAVVNSADNGELSLHGKDHAATYKIITSDNDTLRSQRTAVYTASQPINASIEDDTHVFHVNLYMISSAVALVLSEDAKSMPKIETFLCGTASGFEVRDSLFTYTGSVPVRCDQVTEQCFAVVSLPSPDAAAASPARFKALQAAASLWQLKVYVTLPDGTVTETVLNVDYPLEAGTLEVIKCDVRDNGELVPVDNAHVGATVQLDWKDGGTREIDI